MSFEQTAKEIIDMNNELDSLRERYGKESKLVKKLERRVAVLSEFYDNMVDQKHSNLLLTANFISSQMLREKKKGKSYEDMAKLQGWDSSKWKQLEKISQDIEEVKQLMNAK